MKKDNYLYFLFIKNKPNLIVLAVFICIAALLSYFSKQGILEFILLLAIMILVFCLTMSSLKAFEVYKEAKRAKEADELEKQLRGIASLYIFKAEMERQKQCDLNDKNLGGRI
jgi:ABC-type transport system involved in cytochrome bd biosynthesis fused ATPase/permease subunit